MRHLPIVLVVDMDRDSRETYAAYIRQANYDVDETEDGREALAKAIARPPDIVVTETRLLGISGYDLCRLLKRDPATHAIPIVVLTSDAFPGALRLAEQEGADAVLVKPCSAETVLAEIGRLLEQSREMQPRALTARDRSAAVLANAQDVFKRSPHGNRPTMQNRALHRRYTTKPPIAPPELRCPTCDRPLVYQQSHIGGVSARHVEQWDDFECSTGCGWFEYRQRTRKLRKM